LIGVLVAGVAGAVLMPPAIYFAGLSLAPPPPIPSKIDVPALLRDALWARADGGRATELRPISPISIGQMLACVAYEDFMDETPGDAARMAACRRHLPAIQAVEYLSRVHLQDSHVTPSVREGLGRLSTGVWMTRSWTKAEFINTLAERGGFGAGFRGVEAAARGYFNRTAAQLTLPQAAMIAAFAADRRIDPWCDPAAAAGMRALVLEAMRENGAIDDAAFDAANRAELGLQSPPTDHTPCG
jgi:penicillin-binding protein 1A